ncbi:unnamed protein product [Oncorhynchus mykiss]|uniref:Uncharacterized protein n=1 Tax=Oncorhynchus mykiss TaxID=8022 RepID=A0A060WKQ9_ONCMY|nr:unnamed protein product [Oncorhynchus mykiss]
MFLPNLKWHRLSLRASKLDWISSEILIVQKESGGCSDKLVQVCRPPCSHMLFQFCPQMFYGIEVRDLFWPLQYLDFVVIKSFCHNFGSMLGDNKVKVLWAELKKRVRAMRPTNLTQLHQLCQEEWAKIHPTYCGKLVEGYPKRLTQVKPFKGNATKY